MKLLILMLSVLAMANAIKKLDLSEGTGCVTHKREMGVCTKFSACQVYIEGLQQKTIQYESLVLCSFSRFEEVFCCPLEDTPSASGPALTMETPVRSAVRPSVNGMLLEEPSTNSIVLCKNLKKLQFCWPIQKTEQQFFFTEELPIYITDIADILDITAKEIACRSYGGNGGGGVGFQIVGGSVVADGEFPHMAGLMYQSNEGGKEIESRCGGSLISERYVLTAAHCLDDRNGLPTFVRLGAIVLNSTVGSTDADIEDMIVHPKYSKNLQIHDIALIKLRQNVTFSLFIRPACLYSVLEDIDSNTKLVITGWGSTNVNYRNRSEILLKAYVTTVPLNECNAELIEREIFKRRGRTLNQGHYCAVDRDGMDACKGDSGGPMQLVNKGDSTIVGIVSYGMSCGSEVPPVYVRVAYYLNWIESIVWPSYSN